VAFGTICALAGDTAIETIVPAEGKKPPQLQSDSAVRQAAAILKSPENRFKFIIRKSLRDDRRRAFSSSGGWNARHIFVLV